MTLAEFCRRAALILPLGANASLPVRRFLTDSRSLSDPEGTVFFAIHTGVNDGAYYIPSLYEKGVRIFVTSTPADSLHLPVDAVVLESNNPLHTLQLAARRPEDFEGKIVAVTGSYGKTMLKECLYQLLEPLHHTVRSPRSYNSQIGVPLSMMEIRPDTEIAIIEAGVSRRGEMAALREVIQPDVVIVTNVGAEHDDGFSSRLEKAEEKLSLADNPLTHRIIYSADDAIVAEAAGKYAQSKDLFTWSANGLKADVEMHCHFDPSTGKATIHYKFDTLEGDLAFDARGQWDVQNACHALAFMLSEGYEGEVISNGFASLYPISTRLNVSEGAGGCNIIYDSFTSDIPSLPGALDFMLRRRMPGQECVVIMSDPRHFNSTEGDEYAATIAMLKRKGIPRFIGIGPGFDRNKHLLGRDYSSYATTEDFLADWDERNFRDCLILLKGSPEYDFNRVLEVMESRTHETTLEVNLDAMVRNFNYFRSHLPEGTGMVAMVKASGYGAGSYEIAKTLQDAGAAYLAVAVLDEGVELRRQGITMPIMVMNPRVANYKMMFDNRLEPEIYTFSMLRDVMEAARRNGISAYPIHIKLDTGMHRMGFVEEELPALMDILTVADEVKVASVFSHLATADCPDMDDYTLGQLRLFERMSGYMLEKIGYGFRRHVLNSAGILRFPQYHYDMARLGIGLYGVNTLPLEMEKPLDVVSSLRTVIISVRDRKVGETIGYGRKGVLTRDSRIATIPIGYADGMNRHFGNGRIKVLVNGAEAPTIGNICMDACMIDVTGIDCHEGDTVEVFGEKMPVARLSEALDTIPYEILTSVSPRVKRVYFRE